MNRVRLEVGVVSLSWGPGGVGPEGVDEGGGGGEVAVVGSGVEKGCT